MPFTLLPCLVFDTRAFIDMSINSRRVVALLRTPLAKLGFGVALWHRSTSNIKACKVCEEGLVEDEYHLLVEEGIYLES